MDKVSVFNAGIYIHIPFCKQACTYCDFYFETSKKHRKEFIGKLIEEIQFHGSGEFANDSILTVYIGGGTPSQLSVSEINQILKELKKSFQIAKNVEITMEVNPDDLSEAYLAALKVAGINRLSVGVQTFNTQRLKFMNRAHNVIEAKQVLEWIGRTDFKSWTVDLIYGNPGQTDADLLHDLEMLLSFNPPHISAYTLTVEPHTRLGSLVRKNVVIPLPEDDVIRQMDLITEKLSDAGIHRYEVSNFSVLDHESKHNSAYWKHINYLGLGPSAHSFRWNADMQSAKRWKNKAQLKSYIQESIEQQLDECDELDLLKLAEERILIGLRIVEGIPISELTKRYNYHLSANQWASITEFQKAGFMHENPKSILLTSNGLHIADHIALKLISAH